MTPTHLAEQCPDEAENNRGQKDPSPAPNTSEPNSGKKKSPAWERLYNAETASTRRLKEYAQSDEKKITVFSFSGSGGKKTTDTFETRLSKPGTQSPKRKGSSEKRTPQQTPRAVPRASRTQPNSDQSTFEKLYSAETVSTARLKAHAQSSEKKVTVFTFSGSGGKKVTEPVGTGLPRTRTTQSKGASRVEETKKSKQPSEMAAQRTFERLHQSETHASANWKQTEEETPETQNRKTPHKKDYTEPIHGRRSGIQAPRYMQSPK